MGYIVGIDLGTTNSVVAVLDGSEPRVLTNEEGQRLTPSVVAFDEADNAAVGTAARRQLVSNPARTVTSVKRLMGRTWESLGEQRERSPYPLVRAHNGDVAVRINGRDLAPPEISARILMRLRDAAEAALGEPIDGAVITVPAYFDDAQRNATRQAATIAGIDVKRIINEPTAAALAWGLSRTASQRVVVYDLGGGTFDVSVLDIAAGVIEVRSTAGDTALGGDDIDRALASHLTTVFLRDSGVDIRGDRMAEQRVLDAAERAKIDLSAASQVEVSLPFLASGPDGPRHLRIPLLRADLERIAAPYVARTIGCCERALADAGLGPADINDVLLVGGSTRMPLVRERVRAFFAREPSHGLHPDEAVALGAAVQAGILQGADIDVLLLDVTPLSLGVATRGGLFTRLVPRNSTIPTRAARTFSTAAPEQRTVEIRVYQGERELAADNRLLGRFELGGLSPEPGRHAAVEVEFDIDANGIVHVAAREKATGRAASVTVTDAGGLDEHEVERMLRDARRAEASDRERRSLLERRNTVEGSLWRVTERLRSRRADVTPETVAQVEAALEKGAALLADTNATSGGFDSAVQALLEATTLLEDELLAADAARHNRSSSPNSSTS